MGRLLDKANRGASGRRKLNRAGCLQQQEAIGERTSCRLAGEYNGDADSSRRLETERWKYDALFRPEVRDAYARLVKQGWTDALRRMHPGERCAEGRTRARCNLAIKKRRK
jgi:hypothetical protein